MSWYYPKRAPKAAAGGIRLYKSSKHDNTWWGQRWMKAMASFSQPKRLARGLSYAKSGQVLSIHVDQGFAAAEVQGSRTLPYKVEIGLPMFTHKQWMRVTDAILKKAFYTAKLLAGDMPPEIEKIFRETGAPLIPSSQDDISSDCSCPDDENPCKHVAAVYFILGQEIDRDPFLLMEMRGLSRAQLLTEIQARRSTGGRSSKKSPVTTIAFARPVQTQLSAHLNNFFQAPKDRPLIGTPESDPLKNLLKPGGRIHEMGPPPFWQSDNNFVEMLTRIYQSVRKRVVG